jgi:hypothetical protein
VLFALLLQGVVGAYASVQPASSDTAVHCRDHDQAREHCPCCADHRMMNDGCASVCFAPAVLTAPASFLFLRTSDELLPFTMSWAAAPLYPPLNPPPIA